MRAALEPLTLVIAEISWSQELLVKHHQLMKRAHCLIIVLAAVYLPTTGRAAALDTAFNNPVTTREADPIRVVAMPDDSFVAFGNNFDRINGELTAPLVSFRADGTRNGDFHLGREFGAVSAAAATTDGRLIIAGVRRSKDGRESHEILQLNADGSVNPGFSIAAADSTVRSISIQPDGKVLVGGQFSTINAAARPFLVRLNSNGSIDQSFGKILLRSLGSVPFALPTSVYAQILVQKDGRIVIGGAFDEVNGIAARAVARLNSNGTVDTTFDASGYEFQTVSEQRRPIRGLALQADGRIVVSARFADPALRPDGTYSLARLKTDGSLEQYFRLEAFGEPRSYETRAIMVLPNQDILVANTRLWRLTPDGYPVAGYPKHVFYYDRSPDVATNASDVARQSSGSFIVAGIRYVDDQPRSGLARFLPDGSLAPFKAGEFQGEATINNVASRGDGKIYISGNFDRVDGKPRSGVARLQPNGSLDESFDPTAFGYSQAYGFILHPDGNLFIYGDKTPESEFEDPSRYFAYQRLKPTGEPDPTFQARNPTGGTYTPDEVFRDALLEPDGSYLVLNPFTADAILSDTSIGHLLAGGARDQNFAFGIKLSDVAVVRNRDNSVNRVYSGDNRAIAFLPDGRMLVRYFDATGNYKLIRVNKNGSVDSSFAQGAVRALMTSEARQGIKDPRQGTYPTVPVITAASAPLSEAVLQPDGRVVVVGMFRTYRGTAAPGIVRLLTNGTVDPSFKPGAGAQWTSTAVDATHIPEIDSIEQQPDGKLLIAGNFEAFNGVAAPGIARLNADGTIDTTFSAPAELKDSSPLFPFPASRIYPDANGKYFLTGRYAAPGTNFEHSLLRFNIAAQPLLNISTRASVVGGEGVLIGGIIITGEEPKKVLLRGIGPSLSVNGTPVAGRLGDPVLQLFQGDALLAQNDNWKDMQQSAIAETGVAPNADRESAIIANLAPGAYTAILSGKNNTTGIGLVEAYDLNAGANARLSNISTRGLVQTGDQVMIGGFIIGDQSTRLIVRALGSSLSSAGIGNALADPQLQIFDSSGTVVASNDDWKSDQQAEIEATKIPPTNDAESAIVSTLPPGSYTAVVSGKDSGIGIGLVEVYSIQ